MSCRSDNLRTGVARAPHRSLLKALGFVDEELGRPVIGIANSFNEIIPGHVGLKNIVQAVKDGIRNAGGVPIEFNTIGICDGLAMNHIGMKYSLVTRNIIADSIEATAMATPFDAMVFIPNCDKVVPGMLIAAARLNIPSVFVSGGAMLAGVHNGKKIGDEDDMIFVTMEYDDNRFAVLEWGSAFRWGEHYVLIQGEKGAIKLDMYNTKGTLRVDGKDTYFLIHETQEEDDDRSRIYNSTEMDGAIQYGKPGKRTPLWLSSIMKKEMRYLNDILHGMEPTEEFVKLLTGEAARAAIATADACTRSRYENRKVDLSEIIGK